MAQQDAEPDRSTLCWKCGKEGHQAKECKGDSRCCLCAAKDPPLEVSRVSGSCKCTTYAATVRAKTTYSFSVNNTGTRRTSFGSGTPRVWRPSKSGAGQGFWSRLTGPETALFQDCRILEDYMASDHEYVTYTVEERRIIPLVAARRTVKGWNVARFDKTALCKALQIAPPPSDLTLIGRNMRLIASWCDANMPRKAVSPFQRPAYWWTSEIGELRAKCYAL